MCSKFNFESTDNNGTAVISRLAGGGRGPSVDLDLVAVLFFVRGIGFQPVSLKNDRLEAYRTSRIGHLGERLILSCLSVLR